MLLDADALTLLVDGKHADDLRRDAPLVITPHDGEFKRLAGEAPGPDRVGAACKLAAWINGVVLLKGDRTIVATPAGEVWANPTGTSALATAGSGDVLAGPARLAAGRRAATGPGGGRGGVRARAGRSPGRRGRPGDRRPTSRRRCGPVLADLLGLKRRTDQ